MVTKCANPRCGQPFRYLNQGRLFHLPVGRSEKGPGNPGVEHYWLCDACASRLTLKTDGGRIAMVDRDSVVQTIFRGVSGGEAA